ncbi:MAG: hypothetical protein WDN28_24790 [Chthoniobacter sp.]
MAIVEAGSQVRNPRPMFAPEHDRAREFTVVVGKLDRCVDFELRLPSRGYGREKNLRRALDRGGLPIRDLRGASGIVAVETGQGGIFRTVQGRSQPAGRQQRGNSSKHSHEWFRKGGVIEFKRGFLGRISGERGSLGQEVCCYNFDTGEELRAFRAGGFSLE